MRVVAPGLRKQQVRDLLCMVFVEARAVAQEANSDVERDSMALVTVVEETHRRVGGWASALTDNVFLKLFRGLRDAREAWRQHHGITAADASAGVALSLASVIDRFEVAAARLRLGVTEDLLRLAAAEFDDDDDADAEADADANMDVDEEEEEEQEEEGEDAEAAADAPASGPPGAGAAFTLAIRPA